MVGVVFRGVFPEALGKIGELLKSNSCSDLLFMDGRMCFETIPI